LRMRTHLGWNRGAFGAFLQMNYVDDYVDPFATPDAPIDSWTTADLTLRLNGTALRRGGWLDGFNASLSVSNLLDDDPPEYFNSLMGLRYDAVNARGLGRYLTFQMVKNW